MVMIVEKPGVNVALAQSLLDGREVHIQTVILHDRWRRADTPVRRLLSAALALVVVSRRRNERYRSKARKLD
jgi:hypothetical protein